MRIILFVLILTSTLGCGKEQQEIEKVFQEIQSTVKGEEGSTDIMELMDEASKNYFEQLSIILKNKSEYKLSQLGKSHHCELITRLLYHTFEGSDSTFIDASRIVLFSQFMGMGILNSPNINRFGFKEVEKIRGNIAQAKIRVRARPKGSTYINVNYQFTKEKDGWKINIPSTFALDEKLLKAEWKRSGMNMRPFIKKKLSSTDVDTEVWFRYKK